MFTVEVQIVPAYIYIYMYACIFVCITTQSALTRKNFGKVIWRLLFILLWNWKWTAAIGPRPTAQGTAPRWLRPAYQFSLSDDSNDAVSLESTTAAAAASSSSALWPSPLGVNRRYRFPQPTAFVFSVVFRQLLLPFPFAYGGKLWILQQPFELIDCYRRRCIGFRSSKWQIIREGG